MLNLFRWHVQKCPYSSRDEKRCACPIWYDWSLPDGKRLRKSLGIRDWQAAQRRAREMEADGIVSGGEAITVQRAIADFERDAANNITSRTLRKYTTLFRRLSAFCQQRGIVFLRQLNVIAIRDFRNSWKGNSPRTAGKHIERMKRFCKWCVENRWLETSPADVLKVPKTGDTDVVPFTEEEVERILKACEEYEGPTRARLIVLTRLMLATGLSISDAAMLPKSKVEKNGSSWKVELRRAKTGVSVSCPIPGDLGKAILSLEGSTPFWSGEGDIETPAKNWRKVYARVFRAAGVNGHPHQFRHTTAKRLLIAGVPIGDVARLLGHSVKVCERHYGKWITERQEAFEASIRRATSADIRQMNF